MLQDTSNLALFAIIFPEVLEAEEEPGSGEDDTLCIEKFMRDNFPRHVMEDSDSQAFLQAYVTRLEHMQVPRYSELQKMLTAILRNYLNAASGEFSLSLPAGWIT